MRVARIKIENLLGIDHLEIEPGQFTVLTGPNGAGKTSVLEAIKAVLGGGHDASILRRGTEQGEAVLVLEDGTQISKTVTAEKSAAAVIDPRFGSKMAKPQTVIASLFDPAQLNPVAFLQSKGKVRLDMLLEAIPMRLDPAQLEAAVGGAVKVTMPPAGHALQVIDAVRKEVFDTRTGCNRALKEKRGTIEQLSLTLPSSAEQAHNWDAEVKRLEDERAAVETRQRQALAAATSTSHNMATQIRQQVATTREEVKRRTQEQIDRLRAEEAAEVARLAEDERKALVDVQVQLRGEEEKIRAECAGTLEDLTSKASAAREKSAVATKARGAIEIVTKMKADAERFDLEAQGLTQAIARLDALKADLVGKLPITNLEIRDGEIYLDQVAFDRVNTANQIRFAIELAKLRTGKLPLVVVDGLERMDSSFFQAFAEEAKKTDLQWIVTRVGNGTGLTVHTTGVRASGDPLDPDAGAGSRLASAAPMPAAAPIAKGAAVADGEGFPF